MPNPILQTIADSIPEMEQKIEDLEEALAVSIDAEEDRTAEKAELVLLKSKLAKWKSSLQKHGYKVK